MSNCKLLVSITASLRSLELKSLWKCKQTWTKPVTHTLWLFMSTPISCCREQDSLNKSWWHSTWDYEYVRPDIPPKHHLTQRLILAKTTYFPHLENVQTALGPTQYPIQWLMRVLSLKVGQHGMKLTTHIHLVPESRIGGDKSHLPYMPSKHAFRTTIPLPFTLNKLQLLNVDTIPCLQETQSSPLLSQEPSNHASD